MKRRYTKDTKRSAKKLALEQRRQTRQKISKNNPNLLKKVREQISPTSTEDDLRIDRTKNIEAITKLLAIGEGSDGFQEKIKDLLATHTH